MVIPYTGTGNLTRRLNARELDVVRLPWHPATVLAFEVEDDELEGLLPHQIKLPEYVIAKNPDGPYLCGVLKTVISPQRVFKTADDLLAGLFKDWKADYTHPTGEVAHPLIFQVPAGRVGAGVIAVRNGAELTYGPLKITDPADVREKKRRALGPATLEAMGYARIEQ